MLRAVVAAKTLLGINAKEAMDKEIPLSNTCFYPRGPKFYVEVLACYLDELTLLDYGFLKFLPSLIATSAVFLAKWTLEQSGNPWVEWDESGDGERHKRVILWEIGTLGEHSGTLCTSVYLFTKHFGSILDVTNVLLWFRVYSTCNGYVNLTCDCNHFLLQ